MSTTAPVVLSDLITLPRTLERTRVRDAVLVLGGALFTALSAQVVVHLGFTPVPLTGQTFAVLTVGGVLGARRAMSSQLLYWIMGAVGLPFYQSANSGWDYATGTTFGYFVGFLLAAGITGWFADRRNDRHYLMSLSSLFLASGVIYICGSLWLAYRLNIPVTAGDVNAVSLGVSPFLAGDVIKALLAAAVAPLGWTLYYAKPR
jgi:biotin transport system substrate-specific component